MVIGDRIKNARINKDLSQESLGKLLGVSKVSVCGYELGTRTPSLDTLIKIIDFLDLDPNYLLGRDVFVASDIDEKYYISMSKDDVEIINELKKHPVLYNKIAKSPKRTIELISREITN
ncbi:MAG: helix-turn-helix transcriptional regulator [Bacilli bacterium]|nr:helix-turn-helix transcriptional regulator [Bacilli bacterium]MDD4283000.1 helix-turn-helix transcriptional regulator [Bacilli bacterium]MDD4718925.1 helix-turn-helix transcriptional regulator [Bacilli bacterium]